jgi:alkane 1-monooxygenase
MRDLRYLAAYILPLTGFVAIFVQGFWSWSAVIMAFVISPILDAVLPASKENVPEEQEDSRSKMLFFDILLYSCAPLCMVLLYFFFDTVLHTELAWMERIGMTLSVGVVLGALGINVAHELGHRFTKGEQFLAKLGLGLVLYQHFFVEHNRGHHVHVSTPEDPASARKNESVYVFIVRSIWGQYLNAWRLEKMRLTREGKSAWSWSNQMIRSTLFQLGYLSGITVYFGWRVVPYALGVAVMAILLLEVINYIEHYGLRRKILPNGQYERVSPRHSWNSNHEMGRIMLFELTRHSDHHYKAARKYQILRHIDESPQLPLGYPGSMLMSLIPPLWFSVINKRIDKLQ